MPSDVSNFKSMSAVASSWIHVRRCVAGIAKTCCVSPWTTSTAYAVTASV